MVNPITLKIRTKKLGVLIKDARVAAGKSIKECARVIGVSTSRWTAFERGDKAPSLPELEVLAFTLNAPLEHFWGQDSLSETGEERVVSSNLTRLVPLRGKIVGTLLKKARADAGVTLAGLAESAGIPPRRLKSYENGEKPIPIPELEVMADHLDIPMEQFWDKDGVVGRWASQQRAVQGFLDLPPEMQAFVIKPVNQPYLDIAQRLSDMSVDRLRALAEGLLDITL